MPVTKRIYILESSALFELSQCMSATAGRRCRWDLMTPLNTVRCLACRNAVSEIKKGGLDFVDAGRDRFRNGNTIKTRIIGPEATVRRPKFPLLDREASAQRKLAPSHRA